MKICTKCKIEKDESCFYKANTKKNGRNECKDCTNAYYYANKEEIIRKRKARYYANPEKYRKRDRELRLKNIEVHLKRERAKSISPRRKFLRKKKYHEYWKHNPRFLAEQRCRNRMRMVLKRQNSQKFKKTFDLIGCTPEFLSKYIESKFTNEMSWSNIHIDHIIPCDAYDLMKLNEQYRCFSYRNLRPLLAQDNLKKLATTPPNQPFDLLPEKLQNEITLPYKEKLKLMPA